MFLSCFVDFLANVCPVFPYYFVLLSPGDLEGIFKSTFNSFKSLFMVKPQSAIALPPGDQSSFSIMPDFLTISLSEIELSYSSLTNVVEPEGDTPIKPLDVT